MAEPVQRVSSGGKHFDFAGLMAHEMIQVTKWTGIERRRDFYQAILAEDPNAVLSAFALVAWREAGPTTDEDNKPPRLASIAVDLDDIDDYLHVNGRRVRMMLAKDDDGKPLFVVLDERRLPKKDGDNYVLPTGAEGERTGLVPLLDDDGSLRYEYVDTGEEVRPTKPPTPGSDASTSTERRSGDGSESVSPPPVDALV